MPSRKQREKAKHRKGLLKRLASTNEWRGGSAKRQRERELQQEKMKQLAIQMGLA